jgi:hypothetical protein
LAAAATAQADPRRVVVVGASLAGLRAAESVRKAGFGGEIVVAGAEAHLPYNRPPLSKQPLGRPVEPEWLRPSKAAAGIVWRLGDAAVASSLDPDLWSFPQEFFKVARETCPVATGRPWSGW